MTAQNQPLTKFRWLDLFLGFGGFMLVNLGGAALSYAISMLTVSLSVQSTTYTTLLNVVFWIISIIPWVFNIGAIVLSLVLKRPGIALGILAGFAVAFILVLIGAVILGVLCYVVLVAPK